MKLTPEIVRELLDYDLATGVFTWLPRSREWFSRGQDWKRWNYRYAGKPAGYVHTKAAGYPRRVISLLGKNYFASRLAFLWVGKDLPEQVDHLNRDSLDNRWLNLAPSNHAENGKNRSRSRNNSSGVCGVHRHKTARKWRAEVRLGGKSHSLGYFAELEEAAAAVATFYAANGFSPGHGRELAGYVC